jgi:hypothetical protein
MVCCSDQQGTLGTGHENDDVFRVDAECGSATSHNGLSVKQARSYRGQVLGHSNVHADTIWINYSKEPGFDPSRDHPAVAVVSIFHHSCSGNF